MKKILFILLAFAFLQSDAQHLRPSNYTSVNQRYLWEAGLFNALGIPAGTSAEFRAGQAVRAGALYYDSTGIDSGLYVYSGLSWQKAGSSLDTTSLSNRIDLKVNISDTSAMLAPYLYNANEGLSVSGKYAQFGGPLTSPAQLSTNRRIDFNERSIYFTRGLVTTDTSDFTYRYTPFNVVAIDSVTANEPNYIDVPKHLVNLNREIVYIAPGYRVENRGNVKVQYTHRAGDSALIRTNGGDYHYSLMGETRLIPITGHTGQTVFRTGHGTNGNLMRNEGVPAVVANMFIDSTDATRYVRVNGTLVGFRSYVVTSGGPDTINNVVDYSASQFTPGAHIRKHYFLAPDVYWAETDSSFLLFDTARAASSGKPIRAFWRAKTKIGATNNWTSPYQFDVTGATYLSDSLTLGTATNTADTTGYDVVLRRRSDGTITRVSASELLAFGGGGGGSSLFPTTGTGTATGNVIGDLDGNTLEVQQGGNSFLSVDPTANAERVVLSPSNSTGGGNGASVGVYTTDLQGIFTINSQFDNESEFAEIWGTSNASGSTIAYSADTHTFNGSTILQALAGNGAGYVAVDNNGLLSWNAGSGSGGAWGTITGTLSDQTDLQTALDNKVDVSKISGSNFASVITNSATSPFIDLSVGDGSTEASLRLGRIGGAFDNEISLTADTLKLDFNGNDNIVDITDSADYYFLAIHKGLNQQSLAKVHWPAPGGGSGATWGSITGTLSSQTDLQTALDAKLAHTTANPAHTGTTPSGTGVIGASMFARLTSNHSLADNTTDQPAFSSGFDVWTLQGNTTYEVEGLYHINMGTTTHLTQMGFTLGGGASVTSILYDATSWTNAPGTGQTAQYTILSNVATATTVSLFDGAATKTVRFKGMISMNAGGTVTPFVKFSVAPGGTNEVVAGSYIKFTPIGTGTVTNQGSVN